MARRRGTGSGLCSESGHRRSRRKVCRSVSAYSRTKYMKWWSSEMSGSGVPSSWVKKRGGFDLNQDSRRTKWKQRCSVVSACNCRRMRSSRYGRDLRSIDWSTSCRLTAKVMRDRRSFRWAMYTAEWASDLTAMGFATNRRPRMRVAFCSGSPSNESEGTHNGSLR